MIKNVCLITGGAGFLGKKYCQFFLKKNFIVLCVDNNRSKLKQINLIKSNNIKTFVCDITNENEVQELYKKLIRNFL